MDKTTKKAYFKKIVDSVTALLNAYEEKAIELASKNAPLKVAAKSSKRLAAARKIVAATASKKAKKAAKPAANKAKKTAGAVLKPCPVTGILNKHRRFSYLMPEARTPENLAKFKGAAKAAAKASA